MQSCLRGDGALLNRHVRAMPKSFTSAIFTRGVHFRFRFRPGHQIGACTSIAQCSQLEWSPSKHLIFRKVGAEGILNEGKHCLSACGAQGPCGFCGVGLCCRAGWHDKSKGCDDGIGLSADSHVCSPRPARVPQMSRRAESATGGMLHVACCSVTERGADNQSRRM